jgi:hypothetical protein
MIVEKEKAVCIAGRTAGNKRNTHNFNSIPRKSQGWFTDLLEQEIEIAIEKKQFDRVKSMLNLLRAKK